ncbi:MAG: hypothetical protein AAB019_01050 [Planctomycetota bacterium]
MEEINNNQNPIKDNKSVINRLRFRNPLTGKLNPVKRPIRGVLTKSSRRWAAEIQKGAIKSGRTAILITALITMLFTLIIFIGDMLGISNQKDILAKAMKGDVEYSKYALAELEHKINTQQIIVIISLAISLFIGVIYIVLWFVAKKRPFPALLIAFIIYSLIWLIDIIMNPIAILGGAIKILIFFYLLYGVRAAHRYNKFMKQNEEQSVNPGLGGNQ